MKKIILAAWQQIPSIQSTVAMASLGFDWLIVDLEHTTITEKDAETIFIAAERHKAKPFARLPFSDPYLARRLLDGGAQGLLVPVVESREAFDQFAEHCVYPPRGKRGLGLVRANDWGKDLESYYKNFTPTLIAQIETKKGAENISDILASPFLDGIMIGPYDLSASLGVPGNFEDIHFKEICNFIVAETKKHKKMLGYHQVQPLLEELKKKIAEDYDFLVYGTDTIAIKHVLNGAIK